MRRFASILAIALSLLLTRHAAAVTEYRATLTSDQETPSLPDEGSGGFAKFFLSDDRTSLSYDIQLFGLDFDGLQTPGNGNDNVTRVHIHRAPIANPGPIVYGMIDGSVALRNDLDDLVVNITGSHLSGVWDMNEGNNTTLANELANLEGLRLYLNVHTSDHAGGEIRGQIVPVPEPSTIAMAGIGIAAAGFAACRRRRRA